MSVRCQYTAPSGSKTTQVDVNSAIFDASVNSFSKKSLVPQTASPLSADSSLPPSPSDGGRVSKGRVKADQWHADNARFVNRGDCP